MSDNPDERCYHGHTLLEGCELCEEEMESSSDLERLLAGSVAVQELAKLRKTLSVYCEYLELELDDCFKRSKAGTPEDMGLWRARGGSYHAAKQKLKELLGDAQ